MSELWELSDDVDCKVQIAPKITFSFNKKLLKLVRTPQEVEFYCKGIPLVSSTNVMDASNRGKVVLQVTIR